MTRRLRSVVLPSRGEDEVWELFHEASKVGRYDEFPPQEAILERMKELAEALDFDTFPAIALPTRLPPMKLSLSEAILSRASARALKPCLVPLDALATLLHHAYGVTRDDRGAGFPRPFRAAPSGGALYPLELFFHTRHVEGVPPGLYHYSPVRNEVRRIRDGDQSARIADALVPFQSQLARDATLVVFVTALFERSTFKYAARGYRFVLLEAGHVAQNLNLIATGLELACLNVGGFYDRQADELLGLDGLTHSTIYMVAIGGHAPDPA